MIRFYHRTSSGALIAILRNGFIDSTGLYLTANQHTGVWLSAEPLDANEGAGGDILLALDLEIDIVTRDSYEWVEEAKTYREWLMPASLINCHLRGMEVVETPWWLKP